MAQRIGLVTIVNNSDDDDHTVVMVPSEAVGFVTGSQGNFLRQDATRTQSADPQVRRHESMNIHINMTTPRSPKQTPSQGEVDATAEDAKDYDTRDVTLDDVTLDKPGKHRYSTDDDDHDSKLERSHDPSDDDFSFTEVLVGGLNMWRDVVKYLCRVKFSVFVTVLGSALLIGFAAMPGDYCMSESVPGKNGSKPVVTTTCLTGESFWVMALYLYALILMANDCAPDLVMLGMTIILIFSKVITDKDAWSGFCSTSILAIASLLILAKALEETRAVESVLLPILGNPTNHFSAILRLTLPVVCLSAFLNNTPIVAMLMSVCENWAARSNLSVKCLLMPLSFASLLGGCCTLIGTSTNLVLNGLIKDDKQAPMKPFGLFEFSAVGFPMAVAGCFYMAVFVPLYFRPRRAPGAKPETWWECLNPCNHSAITKNEPTQSTTLDLETSGHSMMSMLPVATSAQPTGIGSRGSPRCVVSPLSLARSTSPASHISPAPRPHLIWPVLPRPHLFPHISPAPRPHLRYVLEVLVTRKCTLLLGTAPAKLGSLAVPGCEAACVPRVLIRAHDVHPIGPLTSPTLLIKEGDRLLVRCLAPAVPALRKVKGLIIRPDASDAPDDTGAVKVLVEATIDQLSPLVGMSLADALASETLSGAHVWAIRELAGNAPAAARTGSSEVEPNLVDPDSTLRTWHRDTGSVVREFSLVASSPEASEGQVKQPSADASDHLQHLLPGFSSPKRSLPLTAGAVLLVEAPNSWVWAHRATTAFAHLFRITDTSASTTAAGVRRPLKKAEVLVKLRRFASICALIVLLTLSSLETVDLFPLALAISACLVAIGCMTLDQAWRAINYRILLVVACSFGPGKALTNTGLAKFAGVALLSLQGIGNFGFLFSIHIFTSLFTSLVSNSTAVITIYAVLRTTTPKNGITMAQMMCCMLLGASTDYITPIGYQTNLMVYKRGGYAFADYTKVGAGLTILCGAVAAGMSMLVL